MVVYGESCRWMTGDCRGWYSGAEGDGVSGGGNGSYKKMMNFLLLMKVELMV